ncbi:hypothetical protein BD410DRAFT_793857 [Rickenella mellea]|uniref:Uncharacterized protein n=1 Tax=Rickenella mellea TaxID=50990 RepID=A0A4Y7PRM4_9AGAM|nr:hypothetical protein BD410DRAFT_793857 [Rickenella mellea]
MSDCVGVVQYELDCRAISLAPILKVDTVRIGSVKLSTFSQGSHLTCNVSSERNEGLEDRAVGWYVLACRLVHGVVNGLNVWFLCCHLQSYSSTELQAIVALLRRLSESSELHECDMKRDFHELATSPRLI